LTERNGCAPGNRLGGATSQAGGVQGDNLGVCHNPDLPQGDSGVELSVPDPVYLSPQQMDALQALEWLDSTRPEDRRSGRSLVLAIHALRRMLRGDCREDGWVQLEDHADTMASDFSLMHEVQRVAEVFGVEVDINPNRRTVRLRHRHSPRGSHTALMNLVPRRYKPAVPEKPPWYNELQKVIRKPSQPRTAWERLLEPHEPQ